MVHYLSLLFAYIYVFSGVTASIIISVLLGLLLQKFLKFQTSNNYSIYIYSFWVGYTILIALLLIINIFYPLTFYTAFIPIIFLCLLSLFINYKFFSNNYKIIFSKQTILNYFCFAVLLILIIQSIRKSSIYDIDLYHWGIVNNANYFPAIKGIVNLHSRLANVFTSLYHVIFLNTIKPPIEYLNWMLKIPIYTITIAIFFSIYLDIRNSNHFNTKDSLSFYARFLYFTSYIILITLIINSRISQIYFFHIDKINYLLILFLFYWFIKFLSQKSREHLIVLLIISLLTVMNKLSSLVLVIIIFSISGIVWVSTYKNFLFIIKICIAGIVLLMPYIAHNIIKSATIIFPASFTSLDFLNWSNKIAVKSNQVDVTAWARNPGIDYQTSLGNLNWVPKWILGNSVMIMLLMKTYMITFIVYIFSLKIKTPYNKLSKRFFLIFSILFTVCTLYWFLMMSDFRFAGSLFVLPTIVIISLICIQLFSQKFFSKIFTNIGEINISHINNILKKFLQVIIILIMLLQINIFKINDFEPPISNYELTNYVMDNVTIYTPSTKEGHDRCGYLPKEKLPCTPYLGFIKDYTFIDSQHWYKGIIKR